MGMFDSVWVPCPKCGAGVEFQTKSGDCAMRSYELDEAPIAVLGGIRECETCGKCGQGVRIIFEVQAMISEDCCD